MKKINKEEFEQAVNLSKEARKQPVIRELNKLKIGEGLEVLKNEWKLPSGITNCVHQQFGQQRIRNDKPVKRFISHSMSNRKGWLFSRVK